MAHTPISANGLQSFTDAASTASSGFADEDVVQVSDPLANWQINLRGARPVVAGA
jgi:hypothetical protein